MSGPLTIIDYGVGNVASIANMLKKAGFESVLSGDPATIRSANKIILPGVGSFDNAAVKLTETGLRDVVIERAGAGVPTLGVCLGMQLLLERSEEGVEPGLGLIPGVVRKFPREVEGQTLRVPHMGWNTITRIARNDTLPSVQDRDRFYFVHSYFAEPTNPDDTVATTTHGLTFSSVINKDNVTGVQFHPEKSHKMGLRLLTDFAGT
jgi:glutamine amidotransferase